MLLHVPRRSRPLNDFAAERHEPLDSPHAACLDDILAWRAHPLEASTRWTLATASIHPAGVGAGARLPASPAALRPLSGTTLGRTYARRVKTLASRPVQYRTGLALSFSAPEAGSRAPASADTRRRQAGHEASPLGRSGLLPRLGARHSVPVAHLDDGQSRDRCRITGRERLRLAWAPASICLAVGG